MEGDYELYHYGVKGMKWGVRRKARKDAKEYARAKVFYGEGAGNRRKLINARVKERSKDPDYKEEFDKALSKQNMDKNVSRAKRERTVRDAVNVVAGRPERVGAAMAAGVAVYGLAHKTGVDKVVANAAKTAVKDLMSNAQRMQQVWDVQRKMRKWGVG